LRGLGHAPEADVKAAAAKQFLPLVSERSMLQDTVLRLSGLGAAAPLVGSNSEHRFLVAEQLLELGVAPAEQLLEPVGRNTAPAATVAVVTYNGSTRPCA
jgi:mannose-1-phosphate guanylyltransferase